ncbi:MAG TPA: purine-nucleoside phosphorylase [Chloroflexi bacterium]|nr:purine-nucleoside phosphorylase [Chloroflexota bacterium]
MTEFFSMSHFEASAAMIRERISFSPRIGLILGSGLSAVADAVEDAVVMPYDEIPHFPVSTVLGHTGRLVMGQLERQPVMVMQGRAHYYEGYSMAQLTFPVRVMQVLGVEILIVTNAAGGIAPAFEPGDVMLLTDHINLIGMAGLNPLRGPNLDAFGPRFPDMSAPYDAELQAMARQVAVEAGVPLREGVYICLSGPSFETPADLRFLRTIGADAVGMSTVPEVTVARHGGTRVLGLSGISNVAPVSPDTSTDPPSGETTHEEVLEAGKLLTPRLEIIIRALLRQI